MKRSCVILSLLCWLCPVLLAMGADKPVVVELWPAKAPDETGAIGPEKIHMSPKLTKKQVEVTESTKLLTNVTKPTITIYRPAREKDTGAAVFICPGGGYWNLYWELEGEEVAAWLNSHGLTGILLKYRVPRRPDEPEVEPARRPLQDAQRAVSMVRSKAKEWNIDPKRIGMVGFSAGGHLAIATATRFEKRTYKPIDDIDKVSCRPDFAIAVYPGYLKVKDKEELSPGLSVPAGTPPIFLAHGGADIISPPEHSVLMYLALKRAGIPAELHIYAGAAHDFGVRKVGHPCSTWTESCLHWLRNQGFLQRAKAVAEAPAAPKKAPEKVVVRGSVVDDMGKPVSGAIVRGMAVISQQYGNVTTSGVVPVPDQKTDDRGCFTLELIGTKTTLTLRLCAQHGNAFTPRAVELHGVDFEKPIALTVSRRNARSLSLCVADEAGKPIAGVGVRVRHRPSPPPQFVGSRVNPVDWPKDVSRTTDRAGRLATPRCLDPDGSYQIELSAEGFFPDKSPWKEMTAAPEIVFEATLRRLRSLEGRVLDRQGKPVAGARVVRSDERQKIETVTDKDGRFQLQCAFFQPGFLFVSKSGFRFHGQRCDRPEALKIALTRRDESAAGKMTTLPPALPRAQRKELAARLLEPLLQRVLKQDDNTRSSTIQTLGRLDPGSLLIELSNRPMKDAWFDGYVRRAAVQGLKDEAPEEAQAIIESMKDPGFRCTAYLDLCDALPQAKMAEKRALLHPALLHARGVQQSDHRIIYLASVARRLWALGDKELATKLLREGQNIARELPTAGWSAYARSAFAEDLALIDLEAALALMKDLRDPMGFVRHHGNLAGKLAGTDPDAAERVFRILLQRKDGQSIYQRDQYAVRVCHRMAPVDLPRARRIAETIVDPYYKARSYGVMAQALARSQPREARELLDRSFDLLEKRVASGQDNFNNFWDAASLAGLMLPAAEAIDPSLVPEFFWRTLSLHGPHRSGGREDDWSLSRQIDALGALALVLARYDHEIALAVVEEARKCPSSLSYNRFTYLRAAVLADPLRAVSLLEELPQSGRKEAQRETVADFLLAEGDAVWKSVHRALAEWFVDGEDE